MKKLLTGIYTTSTLLALFTTTAFSQSFVEGTLNVNRIGSAGIQSVSALISAVFNIAVILAVIFVFFMLIMGGYGWITAGGDKTKVEEARTRITNALIGLAIVAAAWALINIVGQFFGVDIAKLQIPTATGPRPEGGTGPGGL